jgi:intracellular septation protein A
VLTICGGGIVVGGGTVIILDRARWYRRHGLSHAVRAMHALAVVNVMVLGYVAATLISRWDQFLSWRQPLAVAIFAAKAVFFVLLRSTGLEQERREMFGS